MFKILISEKVAEDTIKYLENNGVIVKHGHGLDRETICEDICDCDAVMVRTMRIDRHVLERAPRLKVIAKHGVGCDSIDLVSAERMGIPVVYSPGSNSLSVAEHTIALMLSCAHCIHKANRSYSEGNYCIKDTLDITEISGKTLGLLGLGNVALHVARIANLGFDMRIKGFSKHNDKVLPSYIERVKIIDDIFREADFISLHIPVNTETKDLINRSQITKMKKSAFLINTARGEIVNTEDLIKSLESGDIAGAGLDVSSPEPCLPDSKLFSLDNVVLTPHIGASSKESMVRMGLMAAEGVVDVLNGRKPRYIYHMW